VIALSLLLVLASLGLLVTGLAEHTHSLVWASLIASLAACGCLVASVLNRRRTTGTATGTAAADRPLGPPIDFGSSTVDPALPPPVGQPPPWAAPPPESPPGQPPSAEPPGSEPASPFRPPADVAGMPPQPTDAEQWPAGDLPPDAPTADPDPTRPAAPVDDPAGPPLAAGTSPAAGAASAAGPAPTELTDEPAVEDIPVPDALRVAQLSDEVLVVDGRPRYHLAGCRQLANRATVPLPVSAARRAGFTPCAACRPDHTLLTRSRSAARPPA
jgi:hypothetical protein